MADKTVWIKEELTGGGESALDGISYSSIQDGEFAFVITDQLLIYYYDASNTSSENAPFVIAPDDIGSSPGRWILHKVICSQLGIGISDPVQALDVRGNGYISGSLGIKATSPTQELDVRGNGYISGYLGIKQSSPSYELDVSGDAAISGTLYLGTLDADNINGIVDASAYSNLDEAITDIGSLTKTLLIRENISMSNDVTVPSNVALRFVYPGKITIPAKSSALNETIGTGDGTTTSFSYTVNDPPIKRGSITMSYTIGGTDYTATDNGVGSISGTDCTGTVDYLDGDISLTFSTAPDNGTDITIDYTPTYLLTINGVIQAGLWQIFDGDGNVAGSPKIEAVYPEWFGAVGDGNNDDTDAIQRAINFAETAGKRIYILGETYLISSPLTGFKKMVVLGNNTTTTTLKAAESIDKMLDLNFSSDTQENYCTISRIWFDGNNKASIGIDIRYVHQLYLSFLAVSNCTYGIKVEKAWLSSMYEVRLKNNSYGLYLNGGVNCNKITRLTAVGNSSYGVYITSNEGANEGLHFDTCDIESAAGAGFYINSGDRPVTITNIYFEKLDKPLFEIHSGDVYVNGGFVLYGNEDNGTDNYLVDLQGGNIEFNNVNVATHGGVWYSYLVKGTDGKIAFTECNLSVPIGGNPVISGDVLKSKCMSAPIHLYGKQLSGKAMNDPGHVNVTYSSTDDSITVECTSDDTISVYYDISGLKDKLTEGGYNTFIVVYSTNRANGVDAKFTNSKFSGSPWIKIGDLPNTNGQIKTYIKRDFSYSDDNYNYLEILENFANGDELTVYEIILTNKNFDNTANLHK